MSTFRVSSNSKTADYIEVTVRLRPLNKQEQLRDRESAWEIKMGEATSLAILNRKNQMMIDESRRSIEVLAEGQGKVIALKNKYKFGLLDAIEGDLCQDMPQYKIRSSSAFKLHRSNKKYGKGPKAALYRSHSSFICKDH